MIDTLSNETPQEAAKDIKASIRLTRRNLPLAETQPDRARRRVRWGVA